MISENLIVPNVKKIAILRSGALGDFIVTLPAIQSIRLAYPFAEIILIGRPWMEEFLVKGRTPVDRLVILPVLKGIHEVEGEIENQVAVELFFRKLQEEEFDIAIQFQGKGISANPFIKRLNAKLTVGMECPESESLDRSIPYYYYQSEPLRYLEIARLIGGKSVLPEPSIEFVKKDFQEVDQLIANKGVARYLVLHPFAMDIRRSWPLEKFAELAKLLYDQNFTIIFSGSKQDDRYISPLIQKLDIPAVNLCGKLSLGGLAALMLKSELVISSDTGPLHLARAAGAKTVGIYWAPNLINWGPLSRKNHRPVVSWEMKCPLCGIVPNDPFPFEPQGVTCSHNLSFVKNVKVEEVLKEAEVLLKEKAVQKILQ